MQFAHPTNRTILSGELPKSVAIVALGPSRNDYFDRLTMHEPALAFDEVWAINTGLRYTPHDLAFVMDDLVDFGDRFPEYRETLAKHHRPIITNTAYPEFETSIAYPLDEVVAAVGVPMARCFYHNSIPYVLAYAAMLEVERVTLFGVDYSHPNIAAREAGREVAAVWIGYLRGRGIAVDIAESSSMLHTHQIGDPLWRPFYGYLRQPAVRGVTR